MELNLGLFKIKINFTLFFIEKVCSEIQLRIGKKLRKSLKIEVENLKLAQMLENFGSFFPLIISIHKNMFCMFRFNTSEGKHFVFNQ